MNLDHDCVIVGAGAAGIAAARRLVGAGRSVLMLEASDRVGGRAWTMALDGMPLDLGCGWLHSADRNPLVAVGEASGFVIDRSASAWRAHWRDLGFLPSDQDAADAAWAALQTRLRKAPPASDRASDALPHDGPWNAYCHALSGYMNGAPLDAISIADFLAYDDAATDRNWRAPAGYGTLIAATLPLDAALRLSTPVRGIGAMRGGVRIVTDRGTLTARAALVTVSTNVLARGAIQFDCAADDHLHAASRLPLGLADKLFIALDGAHGLEAETHLLGNPHALDTGSYYIMPFGRPVIEVFFGGTGATLFEQRGLADASARALDTLTALVGAGLRKHLRPLAVTAWGRSDWIGGSYSHALPGCADARRQLAAPIDECIFFAGEATHPTDFSTAHGAWQSGITAAERLLLLSPRPPMAPG